MIGVLLVTLFFLVSAQMWMDEYKEAKRRERLWATLLEMSPAQPEEAEEAEDWLVAEFAALERRVAERELARRAQGGVEDRRRAHIALLR